MHCSIIIDIWKLSWTVEVLHFSWIIQIKAWKLWLHIFGTWELELNVLLASYTNVKINAILFPFSFFLTSLFLLYFFKLSFCWSTHVSFCHQFGSLLVYMSHDFLNSCSPSLKSKWWEAHFVRSQVAYGYSFPIWKNSELLNESYMQFPYYFTSSNMFSALL